MFSRSEDQSPQFRSDSSKQAILKSLPLIHRSPISLREKLDLTGEDNMSLNEFLDLPGEAYAVNYRDRVALVKEGDLPGSYRVFWL